MDNRKKRNSVTVGALALFSAAVFVWGMYWLLGTPVLQGGLDVVVRFDEGAGLRRGDRVTYQGVDIGAVRNVRLAPPAVEASLRLQEGLRLPRDTRAAVRADMFGANTVELYLGTARIVLQDGDTIRGIAAPGLSDLAASLGEQMQRVLTRADTILGSPARMDLEATASVLPSSALEMQAAFVELRHAAASLRRTAEGVEGAEAGSALSRALGEFEASARAFGAAAGAMERSLGAFASVTEKIDRGEGTLGRLVNDPTLYDNLSEVMREVTALTADIRERPRRYFEVRIF